MEQLSPMDTGFLYLETPRTPMHIGSIAIYDPSTAPNSFVRFKDILSHIEERLHLAKSFRRKLANVPLSLDYPYWVDDPDFDLEYHVRHIALPQPGDWRQLCIQAARLHSRPMDLSKPLWEFTVIEGLNNIPGVPKGSYAIVSKIHHAAIDGVSGVDIMNAVHSLDPVGAVNPPDRAWIPERTPTSVELLARAQINTLATPVRLARLAGDVAPGLLKSAMGLMRGNFHTTIGRVPRTRFNGSVTQNRVVDGRDFSLSDIKDIRARWQGATVNDAVVAIVGGAMRKYLKGKSELPSESLVAMAPISVRAKDERGALGNQVAALRKRWLIAAYLRGEYDGAYWGVGSCVTSYGPTAGYGEATAARFIAKVRTDLDAFRDAEIATLENHGYSLAEAAVQAHLPHLVTIAVPFAPPHPGVFYDAVAQQRLSTSHRLSVLGRR